MQVAAFHVFRDIRALPKNKRRGRQPTNLPANGPQHTLALQETLETFSALYVLSVYYSLVVLTLVHPATMTLTCFHSLHVPNCRSSRTSAVQEPEPRPPLLHVYRQTHGRSPRVLYSLGVSRTRKGARA